MVAFSLSSYIAMRVRYWTTISREVIRPSFMAACISRMLDSTTVKDGLFDGCGAWAANRTAMVANTRGCVIAIRRFEEKLEGKRTTLLELRLLVRAGPCAAK